MLENPEVYKNAWKRKIEMAVAVDPATGCWNWGRGCDKQGFPRFRQGQVILYGHKAAAFVWNGVPLKLPQGQRLMHTCGNRKCVNPAHLEVRG